MPALKRSATSASRKTVVITGAASGIGAAAAKEAIGRGHRVAVCDINLAAAEALCSDLGPDALAVHLDVRSAEEWKGVWDAVRERFGAIDVLVNNAGISIHRNAARTSVDEIERVMAVNFFGAVFLTMAALPGMLERRFGSVINVTSVAGYVPNPGESAYGASKAALSRWSHGLAVDLHGTGVHVGVLSPGPIDTEIWSLDEEVSYHGRLHPPELAAAGVARMIERRVAHLTMPRRYGAVGMLYPLLGRPLRWGMRRYEPRPKL